MVIQNQSELGEGSAIPTDPHHTPTILQPSSSQPQKIQKLRKPKRKVTQVPQPSGPTDNVADEAVHKELGDSLVRAATIASSLEAEQDSGGGPRCQENIRDTMTQTMFESVSKHSQIARGNTLQSNEDGMKLNELMELCTNLQNRVLDLEKTKTSQRNEIDSLKRRVKNLEKRNKSRTHKLKRLYKVGLSARVESSRDEESVDEDASKQGRIDDIDADKDITLVNDADNEMFDVDDLGGEEVFIAEREVVKLVEGKEKRAGEELEQEITKKQKVDDDKEKDELKQLMEIFFDEEVAIDVIPLAVKIVGIKSLLDAVGITAAYVFVNATQLELVLLVNFKENMLCVYYCCLFLRVQRIPQLVVGSRIARSSRLVGEIQLVMVVEVSMMDWLSIVETDMVIYTLETGIVKLVVEIESFGMSSDDFDKETVSFDKLQLKQADMSCVHALSELHLHEICENSYFQ
nr:hypothetical protein [Tanacetum cinerariifolium]